MSPISLPPPPTSPGTPAAIPLLEPDAIVGTNLHQKDTTTMTQPTTSTVNVLAEEQLENVVGGYCHGRRKYHCGGWRKRDWGHCRKYDRYESYDSYDSNDSEGYDSSDSDSDNQVQIANVDVTVNIAQVQG